MSAMLSIGRFAQLSGLSVKALRHYDDLGLLAPSHVDPETGYRWYRGSQARSGATISVLRSMGVPLDVVRRVLEEPDRSEGHLTRWRAEVEAERVRQDEAIAVGLRLLASYERASPVVRRQAPVRPGSGRTPAGSCCVSSWSSPGWTMRPRRATSPGRCPPALSSRSC